MLMTPDNMSYWSCELGHVELVMSTWSCALLYLLCTLDPMTQVHPVTNIDTVTLESMGHSTRGRLHSQPQP